jgi:hypothetical protein
MFLQTYKINKKNMNYNEFLNDIDNFDLKTDQTFNWEDKIIHTSEELIKNLYNQRFLL